MGKMSPKNGLVGITTIVILLYIVAIVVGVFGQVGAAVANTLPANSTALSNYNLVLSNIALILPFVGIVAIVGAIVILLDMFGLGDIFNLGASA
jgi:hypothetical protein